MSPISNTTLTDWQNAQAQDPEFVAAEREMETGYQIARLEQAGLNALQTSEVACPDRVKTSEVF